MYIAVSNANGWGRAKSLTAALQLAFRNSHSRDNPDLRVKVWPCLNEATVDHMGDAIGVTGAGQEYRRAKKGWDLVPAKEG